MNSPFQPPEGYTEDSLFRSNKGEERWLKRSRKYAHQRERPTFLELDRRKRRDMAVSLRWRIRTDPNGQGVFTTHDILPGAREWPGDPPGTWEPHAWADFYFMSSRPVREGIFYNAYAVTALEKAAKTIEKMAEKAVKSQMSEEDLEATRLRAFSKPLAKGGSSMIFAPDVGAPSLGGLTQYGAQADWLRKRWNDLPSLVQVQPRAEMDIGYQYGVGLHLVVPEISVDTLTLPEIINQFISRGEDSFEDPPIDLTAHVELLQKRLAATLWMWDRRQAKYEGKEAPELDEALYPFLHTSSNAIRI